MMATLSVPFGEKYFVLNFTVLPGAISSYTVSIPSSNFTAVLLKNDKCNSTSLYQQTVALLVIVPFITVWPIMFFRSWLITVKKLVGFFHFFFRQGFFYLFVGRCIKLFIFLFIFTGGYSCKKKVQQQLFFSFWCVS